MDTELDELKRRLWQTRLQLRHIAKLIPPPGEHWNRAGGGAQCPMCGLMLYDHPANNDGLTILCSGEWVKL